MLNLILSIGISILSAVSLPENFDLRLKYPFCPTISTPLDQKDCGSCWAFSTTSATSDRLCIQGWTTLTMAPEHPIQCDTANTGCNGGYVGTAFEFHKTNGLVIQDCKEYLNEMPRTCSNKCDDKAPIEPNMLYKTEGKTRLNSEEAIKTAIYTRGSIVGSYMVYDSFNDFYGGIAGFGIPVNKDEVYRKENISGGEVTFHAVKFIGWGVSTYAGSLGVKYWLIQNSWGSKWADGGYFRLERGRNTAQIEEDVFEPNVGPYIDRCSDKVSCDECNAVTQLPKADGSMEDGRCGFCQATDQCIEVTVSNKTMADAISPEITWEVEVKTPKRGVCPDISSSVCPLDDCLQMSDDPYRCVQHSGCGYCASTRKCRKGNNESQNVGRCNNWQKTATKISSNHKDCSKQGSEQIGDLNRGWNCTHNTTVKNCGYCLTSGLCLSANEFSPNITNLGRCTSLDDGVSYFWFSDDNNTWQDNTTAISRINSLATSCKYTTKERCDKQNTQCHWDKDTKTCKTGPSTTLSAAPMGPRASNAIPLKDDTVCLGEKCTECNARSECRYCPSTQSCLTVDGGVTTQTSCSLLSQATDSSDELCNDCGSYPSCYECALKAKCGWWEQLGLCMAGRVDGPFNATERFGNTGTGPGGNGYTDGTNPNPLEKYKDDNFTAFKMNCPFVIEYTYAAEGAAVLGSTLSSYTRFLLWGVVAFAGLWALVF